MQRILRGIISGLGLAAMLAAGAAAGDAPWAVPADAKAKKNPVARVAGERDGKKIFETNCALCHGPTGRGDGPAAAALAPKPKNLSDKAVKDETDGELFWKITTGRGPMPPWQALPENDRWSLVHYVRSLASISSTKK